MGIALGIALKFYTSGAKELELNIRKIWGLISAFVEVGVEHNGRGAEGLYPHILKRVKLCSCLAYFAVQNSSKLTRDRNKQFRACKEEEEAYCGRHPERERHVKV